MLYYDLIIMLANLAKTAKQKGYGITIQHLSVSITCISIGHIMSQH